ncbi:MAG: HlyU family transcriptional regulator [Devosia sp.]
MSFWKSLFGGSGVVSEPAASPAEDYKGFAIRATPMPVGGEFQLSGEISKEVGGELKVHKFVRADRMSSRDDAVAFALAKGRLIVDEQGDGMFRQAWPKPN